MLLYSQNADEVRKSVLVIGGCGFIGSYIVDCLKRLGAKVRVLDRRAEMFRPPAKGIEYVIGNYHDSALLSETLIGIDAVVHLASSTIPYTSSCDPIADIRDNLISSVRLLTAMQVAGVREIVYLSSGGTVYGIPRTDTICEDHPLQPISSYGIVKAAIEQYIHIHNHVHGLRYVILRASNPYGPRQGHSGVQGVISTYLWKVARGEPIEIWGDGSVVRDFIHVRDLAELCALSLNADISGIFNAGSGQGTSIKSVVDIVSGAVERDLQPVYKPGRVFDVPRVVLDISRASAVFGWKPCTDLRDGIAETWAWIQERSR